MEWNELKDQLTEAQVDIVVWMADGNRSAADAVAMGLVSQSSINKWRLSEVKSWVQTYLRSQGIPSEEEINLRLGRMVNGALATMENAVGGKVTNKIQIDTAKFVLQSHISTVKAAGALPKAKQSMEDEELDNVLKLVVNR